MKNVLISGLVIGSLIACPIALADAPEQKTEQAQQAESAQPAKQAVKRTKKAKRHHRKKQHAANCECPAHGGKNHSKKRMSSAETPAEQKIDEETELTNR